MRRLLLAAAAAAADAAAAPAFAGPAMSVAIDHTERLQLPRPAGSVIVGNPSIADVTVVDTQTLFVQGKGYGVTEIVVLDQLGRTVWKGEVVVTGSPDSVSVYRGVEVTEMACAGVCAPSTRANAKPGGAKSSGGGSSGGGASGSQGGLGAQVSAPQASPGL